MLYIASGDCAHVKLSIEKSSCATYRGRMRTFPHTQQWRRCMCLFRLHSPTSSECHVVDCSRGTGRQTHTKKSAWAYGAVGSAGWNGLTNFSAVRTQCTYEHKSARSNLSEGPRRTCTVRNGFSTPLMCLSRATHLVGAQYKIVEVLHARLSWHQSNERTAPETHIFID